MILQKRVGRKPRPLLKIALDCGSLSHEERSKGGVATVTTNVLDQLARLDKKNSYILYSYNPLPPKIIQRFEKRAINKILPRVGFMSIWVPLALKKDKPNLFLALSQIAPNTQIPIIGLVYDVAFLHFPKLYKNPHKLAIQTVDLVKKAKQIITISEASKTDILNAYKVSEKKLSVYYPGVSDFFTSHGPKYVDIKKYVLYIGALKKTKNIPAMIVGFNEFYKNNKNVRFILIGSDKELDPEIEKTIKALHLEKQVLVKGYAKPEELPKYYRGAYAFVSTALYEGFGLPLIEAMASGAPVIAGNNSAMKEVVGKSGLLVDPQSPEEIAAALTKLQNNTFRTKLSKLGIKQARLFSWHSFARGILDTFYT